MSQLFRTEQRLRMTTREGLAQALERRWQRPKLLSLADYRQLGADERMAYNAERVKYVSGGIRLPTENADKAKHLFENLMRANVDAPNRAGLIVDAEPHLGKTTLLTALMEWTYGRYRAEFPEPEYRGHVPVVFVEAMPDTSGKVLAKSLLHFFGGTPLPRETTADTIDRVIELMRNAGTHMVCIDEFHNIAANNAGNGHTVDYIKKLHNEVQATFVICGIDVTKSDVLNDTPRGRQLRNRFTKHGIEPFRPSSPDEQKRWKQLLLGFERELPLLSQERNAILQHQSLLMKRTGGSIGALHKLLTRIAIDLIWAEDPEQERLTAERLALEPLDIASQDAERMADVAARVAKTRKTATPGTNEEVRGAA